jgi:cytochrome c peroxidase
MIGGSEESVLLKARNILEGEDQEMMTARRSSSRRVAASLLVAIVLVIQGFTAGISHAQVQTLSCLPPGLGFSEVVIPPVPGILPFIPLTSLRTVPNPILGVTASPTVRADLVEYIANLNAAIQLGKALFWDMQVGSDNKTACATCHFHAGADGRIRNQLHPGADDAWNGHGPNQILAAGDYPFTNPAIPADVDNVTGSQGIAKSTFQGFSKGAEMTVAGTDPVFGTGRQVTGINTPSAVNAVFNHRNFWNGRAQPEFNGVNVWGARDGSARVWVVGSKGNAAAVDIRIQNASLASQAVGPPLNPVEMNAAGRTFPDIGKKLLALKPLGLQKVDQTDSVLGIVADTTTGKGLKVTYKGLIQTAFQPKWWNTNKTVTVGGKTYTMMEANFSLFFGLAIMLYEATLVADDSPMDQYLATRVLDAFNFDANGLPLITSHEPALLNPVVDRLAAEGIGGIAVDDILKGLALFELPLPFPGTTGIPAGAGAGCALCHVGAETTSASVRHLGGHGLEPGDVALDNAGFDLRMERMFQQFPPVPPGTDKITYDPSTYTINVISINGAPVSPQLVKKGVYDSGWYNVGVRPTADNPGLDGTDFAGRPLSWVRFYQTLLSDPSVIRVVGGGLGCVDAAGNPVPPAAPTNSPFAGEVLNPLTGVPLLSGPLKKTEPTDVAGTFKVPGLRNVELTGPYYHNGGKSTLLQAVELYDDGGNFNNPTLHPLIRPMGMTADQIKALVAFMVSLTDERVLWKRAPFDHPELVLPNENPDGSNKTLPAVGRAGSATPLQRFLDLNPFQ